MGEGNIHIFKKRRLLRFCLWLLKTSQTLIARQKQKATVDVYGVCYISLVHLCCVNIRCTLSLYISAWAISALLVHTTVGNAKASKQGTSNRYRFPRFFFLYELILILFEPSGSGESTGKKIDLSCITILWKVILFVLKRMGKL